MNDDSQTPPPVNEPSDENSEAKSASEDTSRPFEDFGKSVQDAFRTGSEDARKAFDKAIPKAKEDLAQGVHDVAYAVAYASAFGAALLKELTPDTLCDGFKEGSDAGRKAAETIIRDRKDRAERRKAEGESTDPGDATPGDPDPVMA